MSSSRRYPFPVVGDSAGAAVSNQVSASDATEGVEHKDSDVCSGIYWWAGKGSNPRPRDYESGLGCRLGPPRDIAPGHSFHSIRCIRRAQAERRSLMGK